ncbi:MAG: TolC family protein [Bacteroidia bacterium]
MKILRILISGIVLFHFNVVIAQPKKWALTDCISEALEKNIQLNQTKLNNRLDKINVDQSKANRYPNLFLSDAHNFNFGYNIDPFTYQYTQQNFSTNNLSASSSVTLFNGFLLSNSIRQNLLLYEAGKYSVEKMKNDISLNVTAAYLQVLYTYEAVDIAKAQMDATSKQVEKTQKYVDAGKVALGNLLLVQSQLAADKAGMVNAENQLQLAKVTLMQLMEMPVVANFDVVKLNTEQLPSVKLLPSQEIYNTAEGIMPEVKSAAYQSNAAGLGLKLAQSNLMPKLTLGGTLKTGYSSNRSKIDYVTTLSPTIGYLQSNPAERVIGLVPVSSPQRSDYPLMNQFSDNFAQAIGLSLTVPIFNNLQGKYGIDKAKIAIQNAKLNEQAAKVQLRKNIEQANTDLNAAIKNYAAAEDGLKAETRSYNDLEKKFGLGMANATDFLVEKNNFLKAELALLQAKYNFIFKSKVVDFYTGKSLAQ